MFRSEPTTSSSEQTPDLPWWREIGAALVGRTQGYTSGSLRRAIFMLAIPMVLEMSMQSVFAVVFSRSFWGSQLP